MSDVMTKHVVDDALLAEVVRRILSVGSPQRIVLFGSQARGDAREDSDMDILIIEETGGPGWKASPRYYGALAGLRRETDVIVASPAEIEDWSEVSNYLLTTALREGRVLYEDLR
jgi:predicted nucleotidyltransferase